MYSRSTQIDDI